VTRRAVIVDDEAHARETLAHYLALEDDVEVVAVASGGREGLETIREERPDLVFLDIRMPEMDGFDLLAALKSDELPFVVFVTAFDEQALEAFRHHALAYLLKPFDDLRFGETMAHVRKLLKGSDSDLRRRLRSLLAGSDRGGTGGEVEESATSREAPGDIERFVVRTGKRSTVVPVGEIRWIEAEGDYVRLHCTSGDHLLGWTLSRVEKALDPERFVRIHRSTIVALNRIRQLRTENHRDFEVQLEGGDRLRLSRTYRERLEAALGDRI